jgi:hypothetical protein
MKFNFKKYKKNIYSTDGEDGIIQEIFKRLRKVSNKQLLDLGAWDGIHCSNTYNLIKNKNFKGILIEADSKRFKRLCENFPQNEIIKINERITFKSQLKNNGGGITLDEILKKNNFEKNFDFLNIDIDGDDYYIFKELKFKPKIICIEYNNTIPNEVIFIQKENLSQGSSAKALIELATKKNYTPIASTPGNLFFVSNRYKNLITSEKKYNIDHLLPNNNKNYVFVLYDGTIKTTRKLILPWHHIAIKEISAVPFFLRYFPGNYNFIQKIIWVLLVFYNHPGKFLFDKKKYLKILYGIFKN